VEVVQLNRTLEQELLAVARGASLECLACGEFVLHAGDGGIECPECGSRLEGGAVAQRSLEVQAG
jgi:Zn finger protein HypA/HybF involved in hydrogenase expression